MENSAGARAGAGAIHPSCRGRILWECGRVGAAGSSGNSLLPSLLPEQRRGSEPEGADSQIPAEPGPGTAPWAAHPSPSQETTPGCWERVWDGIPGGFPHSRRRKIHGWGKDWWWQLLPGRALPSAMDCRESDPRACWKRWKTGNVLSSVFMERRREGRAGLWDLTGKTGIIPGSNPACLVEYQPITPGIPGIIIPALPPRQLPGVGFGMWGFFPGCCFPCGSSLAPRAGRDSWSRNSPLPAWNNGPSWSP